MNVKSDAVGQIIDGHWPHIANKYNKYQIRVLDAIRRCRTASMGGHAYKCNRCSKVHVRYNSCRNRHCNQCQNTQREQWIEAQQSKVLQTDYYHVVFTLPACLHSISMRYPRQVYGAMMRTAWQVIDGFGWNQRYIGAQTGATIVLHTWGSQMNYHPHVHCIVPGGGIGYTQKWRAAKGKGKYLFPVKAMSKVYRSKVAASIKSLFRSEGLEFGEELRRQMFKKDWVVYAKPPFGGVQGVIRYLSRYTHKTAISHYRIKYYDTHKVRFTYTDYRHGRAEKELELTVEEFVRRFAAHILPKGMCRIRHYGILSSSWTARISPLAPNRIKKGWEQLWLEKGMDVNRCPYCRKGRLIYLQRIEPVRGPPINQNESFTHF